MAKDRDIRMMVVYGYSRLVGYDEKLRPASRTSSSASTTSTAASSRCICAPATSGPTGSRSRPRTSATSGKTSPTTPSCRRSACRRSLLVGGRGAALRGARRDDGALQLGRAQSAVPAGARRPEPALHLPAGALPAPVPSRSYVGLEKANAVAVAAGSRSWAGYHQKKDEQYRFDNPDLPTLEPWINTTPLPSTRFVLVRNPYFHRVDSAGRQLPYIDRDRSSASPTTS